MPLKVPSFPVPGRNQRDAEKDTDPCVVEFEEEEQTPESEEPANAPNTGDDNEEEPPEMMDLVDVLEEASTADAAALASALRQLAKRLRLSPEDRETLCDFDGLAHVCNGLKREDIAWSGEAMSVFCRCLPDLCRTSAINRGALRDLDGVDGVVHYLRTALADKKEGQAIAACVGITALCTANDGNKKQAAKLKGEFNEEELVETNADYRTPLFKDPDQKGALDLLIDALNLFPESVPLQTQACAALRTLLTDDDSRQASCVPSAVENRERAVGDAHFPSYRIVVERALKLEATGTPLLRLREQAMLLLREISTRQDRIHELVYQGNLLPRIEASLKDADERVVRASLAVIRAFAFSDEMKEQIAVDTDVALRCVVAVRDHLSSPPIVEQAFGLFANLTMRKPHIATRLNGQDFRVFAVAQLVFDRYKDKPNVLRSVVQTMRNCATQDDACALEAKESGILEQLQDLVTKYQAQGGSWRSPVEIAKQFLREFRADDGLREAAKYNDFY